MASSASGPSCSVVFTTQTQYPLPSQKFMVPASWKRYQLSQLINKALSLSKPVPFDFLVRGEILSTTLGDWCSENGVGEEEILQIEYIESVLPPQKVSEQPHDDWVSSVSCEIPQLFLTASYDGNLRVFDYSKNTLVTVQAHSAPVTSICTIPSTATGDASSYLVASASQDLTGRIFRISYDPEQPGANVTSQTLASLHLHTAPVSSISANSSGSHLITSSWDGLIGLWDTTIPSKDEVDEPFTEGDRKKRRKIVSDEERPKRKAPVLVLKSHTARVSQTVFSPHDDKIAYSCGFDSTVRFWDVETGLCTQTISASEKPFLDIAITSDGHTALAASTDRSITLWDVRAAASSTLTGSSGSLGHSATPSCISPSINTPQQVMSGSYDGVVRLWDLRSFKTAVVSFKAWDGPKKILDVDWKRGMALVGGEGGMQVWKAGEDTPIQLD